MASGGGEKSVSGDGNNDRGLTPGSRPANPRLVRPRTGSLERLPSLKPKRDLTLGGVPKKTFAPTIPTRRIKKEPVDVPATPPPPPTGSRAKSGVDKKGERGRGKGKDKRRGKEIVTSSSVFSMGPAERTMERKKESMSQLGGRGGGGGGWGRLKKENALENHKMSVDPNLSDGDREEPMDTSTSEEFFPHSRIPPTQLPLDYTVHSRHRALPVKQVKLEPRDEQTDDSTAVASKPVKQIVIGHPAPVARHQVTAAELFTPSEDSRGQFLFLQLPDCLPLPSLPASNGVEGEEKASPSTAIQNGSSSRESSSSTAESSCEAGPEQRHCTLHDVPEGYIGKLKVHKSGKVKLTLGDVTLDVAMGTPCGFLQQLASVRREQEAESKMTILGQLSHRLVCTPDFEALLQAKR